MIISQIENFDPFGKFLRHKLHFTPITFGIFVLITNLLVDSWIGWHFNIFSRNTIPPPGILQDFMAIVADFVYMPIICGLYLWAPLGATRVFQQLIDARIFGRDNEFAGVVDDNRSIYSSRKIFFLIFLLALAFGILQLGAYNGWFIWKTVGGYLDAVPEASAYRFPFWILMIYAVSFSAFNVGVTINTLRRLFRSTEIQLLPLHPDKCGGLGAISQYTTRVGFGIGTIGLLMSAATIYEVVFGDLARAIPVILGIVIYLIAAPVFFFLPLGTAHDSMQRAKDEELLEIAQKFTRSYNSLKNTSKKQKNYDEELTNLENIKKLYEVADAFPVWPFDIQNLRRFMVVITTPVLPAIVSILEKYISQWL